MSDNRKSIDQITEELVVSFIHQTGCKTYEDAHQALEFLMKKTARAIEKNNGPASASATCERVGTMLLNEPQKITDENEG